MEYWMIMTGDEKKPGIDGGLKMRYEMGTNTVNTIDTADIDESIEKVTKNVGKMMVPKMAVSGAD
jgi:predicted enzyme related to lactoylglutathione lyase